MKSKRSIESLIDAPSRFDADEYHYYRQTEASTLGEPDVLADQLDALHHAMHDGMLTAAECAAALVSVFAPDEVKTKCKPPHHP